MEYSNHREISLLFVTYYILEKIIENRLREPTLLDSQAGL